ncbi:MAG: PaaI family thioesterase [Marinomonas sp.]|uniref:PaaI family thioesterase n=1 Tax=Parasphingorhabdus sp. TaxID=2709688 RepID=UPI00326A7F00
MSGTSSSGNLTADFAHAFGSPHSELLGTQFESWDEASQTATMRFTVKPEMCTWRGGVQGGLVAGYLDEVMGCAHLASTAGKEAPLNLDISMTLIRLIPQGPIIGKGRVVKAGRRVAFLEAELLSEDGVILARATSTALPTPVPTAEQMSETMGG